MDSSGYGKGAGSDGVPAWEDSSWTDETLPMGLRKELLDRELQKYIAKKQTARPAASSSEARADRGSSGVGHPQADAPSQDDHGG